MRLCGLDSDWIKGEDRRRGDRVQHVKRDCEDGRFAPREKPETGCLPKVCYQRKIDAIRAFETANAHVIQPWGGRDQRSSGGEFDSINEKYELRGKRRVVTIRQAISAALGPRPYCVDRIDLEALNETRPGMDLGPFRLPEEVEERRMWQQYEMPLDGLHGGRRRRRGGLHGARASSGVPWIAAGAGLLGVAVAALALR